MCTSKSEPVIFYTLGSKREPAYNSGMNGGMNFAELGYIRAVAAAPKVALADPKANAAEIKAHIDAAARDDAAVILFPELSVTGYSCEDLFFTSALLQASRAALADIAAATAASSGAGNLIAIVGIPWVIDDARLLNCAAVCAGGRVRAMVPKSAQPNYGEFYDRRWFVSGEDVNTTVDDPLLGTFTIRRDQLFRLNRAVADARRADTRIGIEICEDLWAPSPPGVDHALAGAELILNLSASNELISKADYRRDLVRMASAQRICGYLYASSGPMESTKDLVFGGHLIAAENGQVLGESERFRLNGTSLTVEFDVDKLRHDRMRNGTFVNSPRRVSHEITNTETRQVPINRLARDYPKHPFVPDDESELDARASEVLSIQSTGLARRVLAAQADNLIIGVSGGLDSTLAFLVCLETLEVLGRPRESLAALTLPGPGTTEHTLTSVRQLADVTGVQLTEIDIGPAVTQHLADLGHAGDEFDVVFENAQARERTQILFNYANKIGGIVVGTGDLSELALGWCTFNADQMANYNVNASVPKTMMSYLVRWYARHRAPGALTQVLERVLDTPISPELIPPNDGLISQQTEAIIGPFELHDFFLYHYLRNGFTPEKIFALASAAFADAFDAGELKRWLGVFFQRFFSQQFKRTTLPPGPKVGSISLSPRGDWRMPDEASVADLLARIEAL
jgi:NAD+ synthase (glutamine-hydrolysing)